MKRGPRSLLWRLGALALSVTFVSLVLHVAVITIWLRPVGERMFLQIAARAQATRALLQATAVERRNALVAQLSDDDFRVVRGAVSPSATAEVATPIRKRIAEQLGNGFQVLYEPVDPLTSEPIRVRLAFTLDNEPWHVAVRAQPLTTALLGTGAGWLMLAAVAVAASFLIGLRFIVGPIRQVAERIATQGAAMRPLQEPAGASAEVRSLVESFNRLAERVQAADRSKQQLLAGVSHDLRTPLARLRLRIETQCEAAVADAAEPELRAVEHIVSQFLAFVHGDTRAGLGAAEPVLATLDRVVAAYAEQGVRLRTSVSATGERRSALALQRLLENLINNALAHGRTPVQVSWLDNAAGERELGVWDHGPGLTEAQFQAALEPFVRLSKDANIGHCGLGLAIVAQIAAQWGARLESRHDDAGRFGIVVAWSASASSEPR